MKTEIHRFVFWIALRQHMPLSTGIENPQNGFKYLAGGDRLAARWTFRDIFYRKMLPDPFPVIIAQAKHAANYT